jgi:hypothetical protein
LNLNTKLRATDDSGSGFSKRSGFMVQLEPATGESFFWQFYHVDTACYQRFLDEFSQTLPDSLNIFQVDNRRFHRGKDLIVPENHFVVPTALLS